MDERSVPELRDEAVATFSATEIMVKGVMIVAGIIGGLGYVRWFESDLVAAYRVGAAGFAVVFLMLVVWDFASSQVRSWRSWQLWWHVGVLALFATSAVIGPP